MSYTIKKLGGDERPLSYINVTSITGLLEKPQLKSWAANLAVDYIETHCNNDVIEHYDLMEICELARYAHKNRLTETADIGSELHNMIEMFINIKLRNNNHGKYIKTADEFNNYNYLKILLKDKSSNLKQMFMQFYIWQRKNVKQFLESERPICHEDKCFAGTLDFVYIGNDDKVYLCDLKTSNAIYKEQHLQAVSYKQARESMEGEYEIFCERNGNKWTKRYYYDKLNIDKVSILNISRDYFHLEHKVINDVEYLQESFNHLLSFYYTYAKRRLNNKRAKNRK